MLVICILHFYIIFLSPYNSLKYLVKLVILVKLLFFWLFLRFLRFLCFIVSGGLHTVVCDTRFSSGIHMQSSYKSLFAAIMQTEHPVFSSNMMYDNN